MPSVRSLFDLDDYSKWGCKSLQELVNDFRYAGGTHRISRNGL